MISSGQEKCAIRSSVEYIWLPFSYVYAITPSFYDVYSTLNRSSSRPVKFTALSCLLEKFRKPSPTIREPQQKV